MIFKDLLLNLGQAVLKLVWEDLKNFSQVVPKKNDKKNQSLTNKELRRGYEFDLAGALFAVVFVIVVGGSILIGLWGLYWLASWLDDSIVNAILEMRK